MYFHKTVMEPYTHDWNIFKYADGSGRRPHKTAYCVYSYCKTIILKSSSRSNLSIPGSCTYRLTWGTTPVNNIVCSTGSSIQLLPISFASVKCGPCVKK